MNDLTKHFKNELIKQLQTVDWMDEETRRRAVIKAQHINYKSGFPSYIFNESYMEKNWALVSLEKLFHLYFKYTFHVSDDQRVIILIMRNLMILVALNFHISNHLMGRNFFSSLKPQIMNHYLNLQYVLNVPVLPMS